MLVDVLVAIVVIALVAWLNWARLQGVLDMFYRRR
jgi:uncharacterized protein YybS (DUF2232 family)